jgi:thiamine-monophosphate kinase
MGRVSDGGAAAPADGEEAFLERLYAARDEADDLVVPVGDDAAVFRAPPGTEIVVAADAIAAGTHFAADAPPELIGRKALAVNLSDFAAMGATPRHAFATACLPRGFAGAYADALTAGLRSLASRHGVLLSGGDTTTHAGALCLSVTVVGFVAAGRAVRRDGARPGDVLAVTGPLGGSLPFGRHLTFEPRLPESRALVELGPPSAMMDVSDGLLLDLGRLCRRSGVAAVVDAERVPIHDDARRAGGDPLDRALADGEDFELLFAAPPAAFARIVARWPFATPPRAIGEIRAGTGISLRRAGVEAPVEPRGYEHR